MQLLIVENGICHSRAKLIFVVKYGYEEKGYDTMVAEILTKNYASQTMVEKLGFELHHKDNSRHVYARSALAKVS